MTLSKRVDIPELSNLGQKRSLKLLEKIYAEQGSMIFRNQCFEKIDGEYIKFGLDENNRFFVESSHVGPIFEKGGFEKHASKKYSGDELNVARRWDNLFEFLLNNKKLMNNLIYANSHGFGVKVYGEILYTPSAKKEDETYIQFNLIPYKRALLGYTATLVVFKVDNSMTLPYFLERDLGLNIYKVDRDFVCYRMPQKQENVMCYSELKTFFDTVVGMFGSRQGYWDILNSRKLSEKPARTEFLNMMNETKEKIGRKIVAHYPKGQLGEFQEGIVCDLGDNIKFKVLTPHFINAKNNISLI